MDFKLEDKKAFLIGFTAGLLAIVFWDVIKSKFEIYNFKNEKD